MALRQDDDTEFNDALRAHGILPPLPPAPPTPSPPHLPSDPISRLHRVSSTDDSEALEGLEDDVPSSVLESWRAQKKDELARREKVMWAQGGRGGGVRPIGREDYQREVNDASAVDLADYQAGPDDDDDDEGEDQGVGGRRRKAGTGVVLCLYDSAPNSTHLLGLLEKLSRRWPATRFLSIPGVSCIPNYPASNHPTLILYRKGECVGQVVGLGSERKEREGKGLRGVKTGAADVEAVLRECGVLDEDLVNPAVKLDEGSEVREEEEDDGWGSDDDRVRRPTGGGGKKGYVGQRGRGDDSSGSDLDI